MTSDTANVTSLLKVNKDPLILVTKVFSGILGDLATLPTLKDPVKPVIVTEFELSTTLTFAEPVFMFISDFSETKTL